MPITAAMPELLSPSSIAQRISVSLLPSTRISRSGSMPNSASPWPQRSGPRWHQRIGASESATNLWISAAANPCAAVSPKISCKPVIGSPPQGSAASISGSPNDTVGSLSAGSKRPFSNWRICVRRLSKTAGFG